MIAHYHQAKQLLELAHHLTYGDAGDPIAGGALATEAQAAATLALVEVIVLAGLMVANAVNGRAPDEHTRLLRTAAEAWAAAIGVAP